MLGCQFCGLANEGPDIIMHQLKSSYNSPFKDSHSNPIHTRFAMIASNDREISHVQNLAKSNQYVISKIYANSETYVHN